MLDELNELYGFKRSPDMTGWYVTATEKVIITEDISINRSASTLHRTGYYGPFTDKASAVEELRDMIQGHLPNDWMEYLVAYYNVSIIVDKNAGSWIPKQSDYSKE